MVDDARLQALYRRLAARDASAPDADALGQVLTRAGWPDEEGTPLDRVSTSARDADVLRVALALAPEAQSLAREVQALRAPRRPAVQRWLAAAAGVGAVAVLVSAMQGRSGVESAAPAVSVSPVPADEIILSASFEAAPIAQADEGEIFGGGFDS